MSILGKIIYSTISNHNKVEALQQNIRDVEWNSIRNYIKPSSYLLDVGCGSGYAMQKAKEDFNCICKGVDPDPGAHGVGRYLKGLVTSEIITKSSAESLPFQDRLFDIVYSSHVLEHVQDETLSLKEMNRVLKNDGVLIIGVPTSTMAIINWFSNIFFTTHIRFYEFFRFFLTKNILTNFFKLFRIKSHSYPRANSIFYDFFHYRVGSWEKTISKEFDIIKVIKPFLYPYPDYPQWFKPRYSKLFSSSAFFICKKKDHKFPE